MAGRAYRRCADAVPGGMRVETVPVEHACGRVLAQAVTAPEALPRLALAAIEGYALRAIDAAHASPARPATLNVRRHYPILIHRGGDPAARALSAGDAEWLPAHADTVVPRSQSRAARITHVMRCCSTRGSASARNSRRC
ncbi:hypothetical protein WL77_20600 [Burkholderia ubonensis]|uniref:hypothetical protein n=1 Tax=Burkholderia ubonensis TaxID=101571 RepID=UPI0007559D66|nr:hypothetical protein [Burkholderia ubonensis]KWE64808.1 hypothetical protein WL77_20600 [Burkholderia ubonensis]KWE79777.1 hypothetical protein WL79_04120 [Burkholderia ubonensis]